MSVSLAQRFVTTTQGQSQFLLQLIQVAKFPLHIGQLFFQSALDGPTGLQAIPPQSQESSDLAELEPQALHAANKGQGLHIVFASYLRKPPCVLGGRGSRPLRS